MVADVFNKSDLSAAGMESKQLNSSDKTTKSLLDVAFMRLARGRLKCSSTQRNCSKELKF